MRLDLLTGVCAGLVAMLGFSGTAGQAAPMDDLARTTLFALQAQSIQNNREYCGIIVRRANGNLYATQANRGTKARCRYPNAGAGETLVASYHTHGAYLRRYDNEVPSVLDVITEMLSGTPGYVSTPGGRLWKTDGKTGAVHLICGPKCLPWDPRFVVDPNDRIAQKYSLQALKRRAGR